MSTDVHKCPFNLHGLKIMVLESFSLKAVDTIGLLKIIIVIKPYLVTSNGERLVV